LPSNAPITGSWRSRSAQQHGAGIGTDHPATEGGHHAAVYYLCKFQLFSAALCAQRCSRSLNGNLFSQLKLYSITGPMRSLNL
jgi:hypothetical protein